MRESFNNLTFDYKGRAITIKAPVTKALDSEITKPGYSINDYNPNYSSSYSKNKSPMAKKSSQISIGS